MPIPCPDCGKPIKIKKVWMQTCEACNHNFSNEQLDIEVDGVEFNIQRSEENMLHSPKSVKPLHLDGVGQWIEEDLRREIL